MPSIKSSDYGLYPPPEQPPLEAYIPGFPGLMVNSLGQFYSCRQYATGGVSVWRPLRIRIGCPTYPKCGYYWVALTHLGTGGNSRAWRRCRRLVAEAFLGPKPPDHRLCSLDGDKKNHRLDNLGYYHKDNLPVLSRRRGMVGSKNPRSLVTEDTVIEIRRAYHYGEDYYEIAARFGLERMTIRQIISGKNWPHVDAGVPLARRVRRTKPRSCGKLRLPEGAEEAIRSRLREGMPVTLAWLPYKGLVDRSTVYLWQKQERKR